MPEELLPKDLEKVADRFLADLAFRSRFGPDADPTSIVEGEVGRSLTGPERASLMRAHGQWCHLPDAEIVALATMKRRNSYTYW